MHNDSTPVRILQITDTHLFARRNAALHDVVTRRSLQSVLQHAAERPKPELVLVTGDLVHDESPAGYRLLFRMLRALRTPVAVIPGNHDSPEALRRNLPKAVRLGGVHLLGAWRVVMLNSQVPGHAHGHLDPAELYFLEAALTIAANRHVLVVLHHNPLAVRSAWLDRIALENPEELFAVLERFDNVRAVLCGHVHQEFDLQYAGRRFLATPSTCVQFRPHSQDFAVDDQAPGMRWLTLNPDGSFETEIERVTPRRP